MKELSCPFCHSTDVSPAEKEFKTEYPFWMALAAVFLFIVLLLALFFFLQLHPVIMILLAIAAVSKLLQSTSRAKKGKERLEFICLKCKRRFKSEDGEKP